MIWTGGTPARQWFWTNGPRQTRRLWIVSPLSPVGAEFTGPFIQDNGKTYGLKVHEFRKMIDLPQRSGLKFEIALQIHPADKKDLDALLAYGWQICDPQKAADSPDAFRRFVQTSGAEFSVAQGVYVDTRSGWVRIARCVILRLASPLWFRRRELAAPTQLVKVCWFSEDIHQAIEGANRIARDYKTHCRAARRIAEEYFASDKVIRELAAEVSLKLP